MIMILLIMLVNSIFYAQDAQKSTQLTLMEYAIFNYWHSMMDLKCTQFLNLLHFKQKFKLLIILYKN